MEISVLLPVYNGGQYLRYAVESVLNQPFQNYELLIIDDCSTDGCWQYLQSIDNARVTVFKNDSNKGLFYNLNFLIHHSKGKLIKLWSQDDVMLPKTLEKIADFHQQHPEIGMSYTAVGYMDEDGKEIIKTRIPDNTPTIIDTYLHAEIAFFAGSIAGNIANVTLSKRALDKVGLFNEQMKISSDFEMWVRIAEFYDIGFLNEELILLRDHKGQLSRQENSLVKNVQEDVSIYKYLLSYLPDEKKKNARYNLRKRKLGYYFILMFRSFLKLRIRNGIIYWKCIGKLDNRFIAFMYFAKSRLGSSANK